jgi:multimeric flavodoxin WrbA
MKVIAFNGSPRKDGNTNILVNYVLRELEQEGIETELIHLGGQSIKGCDECYLCAQRKDKRCAIKSDKINEYIEKILEADGVILGSPAFFAEVTTEMKAFIDRVGMIGKFNDDLFRRKVGAPVVAARRAGAFSVCHAINAFFLANQIIVPGSSYLNVGYGWDKGQVEKDEEGVRAMKILGQNMAWLLKIIHNNRTEERRGM